MNRRIYALLAAVLLTLTLTACGEVKEAEEAIDAIGPVTIHSLEAIEYAEDLYIALGDKKSKVDNLEVLIDARAEYGRLTQVIADANKSMDAISVVTPESGDIIEAGWRAYYALENEGLTSHVPGMSDALRAAESEYNRQATLVSDYDKALSAIGTVTMSSKQAIEDAWAAYDVLVQEELEQFVSNEELIAAEEAYDTLYVNTWYQDILDMQSSGKYQDAIDAVADLYDVYPDHAYTYELSVVAAECDIALAQKAYNSGDLETALNHLQNAEDAGSDLADYKTLLTKVNQSISAARPANGKVLLNKLGAGYGKLIIIATDQDVCVTLESMDNANKYVTFYIRAGEQAKVSVPYGKYILKYTYGDIWFGEEAGFGSTGVITESDEVYEFTVSYSGNYVYYTEWTITI